MKRTLHPTEHSIQVALFEYAAAKQYAHPELKMLFAIPNGGKRHIVTATRLKKEGCRAGLPDICLPVARGAWLALYIELKTAKGKVSEAQQEWIERLTFYGNKCLVCHSLDEAIGGIERYLKGER